MVSDMERTLVLSEILELESLGKVVLGRKNGVLYRFFCLGWLVAV